MIPGTESVESLDTGGEGRDELRVLALTSLYPNRCRPRSYAFNRQQLDELARLCRLGLVAPVLATHLFSARKDCGPLAPDPFPVLRPTYWYVPKVLRRLHAPFFFTCAWPSIRKMAAMIQPQVLYATWLFPDAWAGAKAAGRMGIPYVVKLHGSDLHIIGQDSTRHAHLRQTLANAAAVVTVSPELGQRAIELGAVPDKIRLVPNGVDLALFQPRDQAQARHKLGMELAPGERLLLFVGNLLPVKGVLSAVEALPKLPGVRLVMVGEGPLAARLRQTAQTLDVADRLTLTGEVAHDMVPWYLAACDALVLPSISEGEPNAVLEALAAGRPIAASNVEGVARLVVEGEQGFLFKPQDPDDLARAVRQVLARDWDPDALRASVADRSWPASAIALREVLAEAAAGRA